MRLFYHQLVLEELVAPEVLQVVSEPRSRVRFPAGAIAEGEIVDHSLLARHYPRGQALDVPLKQIYLDHPEAPYPPLQHQWTD
ncbi:unnamed protein product [Cuscuta campestris]|uniref:Uncharacterized protein n=1 Tax=Cuscuta campestris TaxID=132261 RepID=A0A484N3D3_9ASTE|nr:unnamed protein product [Cuscuta campestris]